MLPDTPFISKLNLCLFCIPARGGGRLVPEYTAAGREPVPRHDGPNDAGDCIKKLKKRENQLQCHYEDMHRSECA
jgi:hypothetical protein